MPTEAISAKVHPTHGLEDHEQHSRGEGFELSGLDRHSGRTTPSAADDSSTPGRLTIGGALGELSGKRLAVRAPRVYNVTVASGFLVPFL